MLSELGHCWVETYLLSDLPAHTSSTQLLAMPPSQAISWYGCGCSWFFSHSVFPLKFTSDPKWCFDTDRLISLVITHNSLRKLYSAKKKIEDTKRKTLVHTDSSCLGKFYSIVSYQIWSEVCASWWWAYFFTYQNISLINDGTQTLTICGVWACSWISLLAFSIIFFYCAFYCAFIRILMLRLLCFISVYLPGL